MIKEFHESKNLYNYQAVVIGKYINANGEEVPSTGAGDYLMNHTDYASITSGESYYFKIRKTYDIGATSNAFCWFDSDKNLISRDLFDIGNNNYIYATYTAPQNAAYLIINFRGEYYDTGMLNVGSTAQPYEPYGDTWNTKSYVKSITGTQTYTKFPIVLRTTEQSIPTWSVKGNMVQSGTPTPTTPIAPSECGERTENLLDYSTFANDYWLNIDTGLPVPYGNGGRIATITPIDVSNTNNVTFSYTPTIRNTLFIYSLFDGSTLITRVAANKNGSTIDVSGGDTLYLCMYSNYGDVTISDVSNAMLNVGSTAKPYEPYGCKLPVISGNTTTNIYLKEPLRKIGDYADTIAADGTVTRRIKKIVLTGQEVDWRITGTGRIALVVSGLPLNEVVCVCSHYKGVFKISYGDLNNGECTMERSRSEWAVYDSDYNTVDSFKAFLAQQYSAGTPVTVWYVLSTPTTETITAPSIPTTSGLNTIDVATTLKPSEMSLTYDGYKLCKGQRYSRTENLFDKDNATVYQAYLTDTRWLSSEDSSSVKIPCQPNTTYTISVTTSLPIFRIATSSNANIQPDNDIDVVTRLTYETQYTFSTSSTAQVIIFQGSKAMVNTWMAELMINTGSTAKPYQPYLDWK